MTELPNRTPRPPGEFDRLKEVWKPPSGWNFITVVNNTYIGILYIGTAFLFFILAGVLALLMRSQLAVPENDLLDQDLYNQLFTMHGRSEEHTSELQSLMRISYAVFCLKKKTHTLTNITLLLPTYLTHNNIIIT